MMIKKNKKALEFISIIFLIVSIISLIIIAIFVKSSFDNSVELDSIVSCSMTFDKIAGNSNFFNGATINNKFVDLLSYECPLKYDEKSSIKLAVDNVINCYKKTDKGKNIFVASSVGETVCLYCANMEFDRKIDNFNTKFINELNRRKNINLTDSETKSLNKFFLYNNEFLPKSIDKNDMLNIVYYTRYLSVHNQGDSGFENDNSGTNTNYVNENLGLLFNNLNYNINSLNNYFLNSKSNFVVTGISVSKQKKLDLNMKDFSEDQVLQFGSSVKSDLIVNCGNNLIIPKKIIN